MWIGRWHRRTPAMCLKAILLVFVIAMWSWTAAAAAQASPGSFLTRAELSQILVESLGLETYLPSSPTYSDVPLDHWAAPFIYAVSRAAIIRGYPDGTFNADGSVTRPLGLAPRIGSLCGRSSESSRSPCSRMPYCVRFRSTPPWDDPKRRSPL